MTRPSPPAPRCPAQRFRAHVLLVAVLLVAVSACQSPEAAPTGPDSVTAGVGGETDRGADTRSTDGEGFGAENIDQDEDAAEQSSARDGLTTSEPARSDGQADEVVPIEIRLAGDITSPDAEISSMAWLGDTLVLMPQYPGWARAEGAGDGVAYAIDREAIVHYLDTAGADAITPREIPFDAGGLDDTIDGFEGFEAIVFDGDRAYLAVEAETPGGDDGSQMYGYLVAADVLPDASGISVDSSALTSVTLPVNLPNMSIESLLLTPSRLTAIFEANGQNVSPSPEAAAFNLDLTFAESVAFPTIEYRVTDATAMADDGSFWVANYYWPGEAELLRPAPDAISMEHGQGPTHAANEGVERLVQMRAGTDGIAVVASPPVQLAMLGDENLRNWEGLVRLGDRGWLLATDSFPTTMLAFVPMPTTRDQGSDS